jgi:hypothetical protein
MLAKQALYHLAKLPVHFALVMQGLVNWFGLASNHDPPDLSLPRN